MLTPGACACVPLRFPGMGVGWVGIGVGPLVWSLLPELRVAGVGTLGWAELKAGWPCGWCSRLVWVPVWRDCGVGVGAGL